VPAWPLRGPAARRRTVGVGLASKAPSDRQALRLLAEHVAEALAGAAPPWQASEVLTRLRALGSGVDGGFDVDAYGGDLCLGSALGGVGGWFGVDVGGWFS